MPVIEAQGLKKTYHTGEVDVEVLRGIDLEIARGEFVAIMGPSGSGKSTLLHLLGGVDVPTADGWCWTAGIVDPRRRQADVAPPAASGFIFQSFNLLPALTAEENVALPLELDGCRPRTPSSVPQPFWSRWACPSAASTCPANCRAANNSVWRWPARWRSSPWCYWPTNRRAIWTASTAARSPPIAGLVDELPQTIVMVTHDRRSPLMRIVWSDCVTDSW